VKVKVKVKWYDGMECILKSGKKLGSGEVIIYEMGIRGRSSSRLKKDDREEMPCTLDKGTLVRYWRYRSICGLFVVVSKSRGGSLSVA
jgi:hypothetical protein